MRKPSFKLFYDFKRIFDQINKEEGLRQQLIPYFISSHPGCHERDMAQLADLTRRMGYKLEQVQDFTPTPMTVATETWYTGYDPYTLEPVFSAKTQKEKLAQRQYFFWYKNEEEQSRREPKDNRKKNEKRTDHRRERGEAWDTPQAKRGGKGKSYDPPKPKSYNPNFTRGGKKRR